MVIRTLALLTLTAGLTGCGMMAPMGANDDPTGEGWRKVVDCDFSKRGAVDDWVLEGAADVSVTPDGWLAIATVDREAGGKPSKKSQLWYPKPLEGDVRIEFEARGGGKDGSILIFNAQALPPHTSIFEFPRPQATNADFVTNEKMRDYTIGFLRQWQDKIRLRYNGGERAYLFSNILKAPKESRKEAWRLYDEGSVIAEIPTPYTEVDKAYHIDLRVTGPRIRLFVDGKLVMDAVDEWHKDAPLRGGWFALRNWKDDTTVRFNSLKAYTKEPSAGK